MARYTFARRPPTLGSEAEAELATVKQNSPADAPLLQAPLW